MIVTGNEPQNQWFLEFISIKWSQNAFKPLF